MKYERPSQSAQRLGVTTRAIQKWAVEGRIPNACKMAGQWMIPVDFKKPVEKKAASQTDEVIAPVHAPVSLLNADFEAGECWQYIESLSDDVEKQLALAEYYYYTGLTDEASDIAQAYLNSKNPYVRNTACLVYMYANMSRGKLRCAQYALGILQEGVAAFGQAAKIPELHSLRVWVSHTMALIFHTQPVGLEPLEDWIRFLPEGMKLYACYVLAYRMRQAGKYQGAHSVARIADQLSLGSCVLARISCNLIDAIALMDMKMVNAAEERFAQAWELARKDGFIELFAEHYLLCQGLVDRCLKNAYPEEYKKILTAAHSFYIRWRTLNKEDIAPEMENCNLTISEFLIAALYSNGWSAKEIGAHLDMSVRTVYRNISNIYSMLGIGSVADLKKYMSHMAQ